MVDLHRHDEFSTFDGFGKAAELVELAKNMGHTSAAVSNHGNTNGLVKHYQACKKNEINCIMGVEAYFQPVLNREKPRYHLCLYVKNLKGYKNLNELQYIGEMQKYYNPIITFADLMKYREGLICTSACIQGILSKALEAENYKAARSLLIGFVEIFGNDFYIEIQPYKIDEEGTQERINKRLMKLAFENDIKCILTSDSHYGAKEDFPTYLKMHEIAGTRYDIESTYGQRYMPSESAIVKRFVKMHESSLKNARKVAIEMIDNLCEIENKIEQDILDLLELNLPSVDSDNADSFSTMKKLVISGLKERGKWNSEEYKNRCAEEMRIIKMHGFTDYFLIVADYVRFARENKIHVGPGRGSVCNCQVAWALGITQIDSIKFGLDFQRFLREDKAKMPDIDLDFPTSRRGEVIEYLINKYHGKSARVISYGLYKVDNLINDLSKVCGLDDANEKADLKRYLKTKIDDTFHFDYCESDREVVHFNTQYDNIVLHFKKLFNKVRFIGTHAAGVAIVGDDIKKYTAIKVNYDKETGAKKEYTAYDLADMESVHVVKFDMLGLTTMDSLGELRNMIGNTAAPESMLTDKKILNAFANAETDGIFQFEKSTPKRMLMDINADRIEDIIAINSMNRPGPLMAGMPDQYIENKNNQENIKKMKWYEYTKETYGVVVYQEQLQRIAVNIGGLSWADADRIIKLMKPTATAGEMDKIRQEREELTKLFVRGAMKNGWSKEDAQDTFKSMLAYVFNKGHATAYVMIALEEMYYKIYYPTEFWYVKMKYNGSTKEAEKKLIKYKINAAASEVIIFLPHVNYSSDFTLRKFDGEMIIQEGLSSIKDVGEKAALFIEGERKRNGIYTSFDNFYDRCKVKGSAVTSRVVDKLKEQGALEFNKKIYLNRVIKYNSSFSAKN